MFTFLTLFALVVIIALVIFGIYTAEKNHQAIPLSGNRRHLSIFILVVLYGLYSAYELRYGYGAGADIRVDLIVILPLLVIATYFLTAGLIASRWLRFILPVVLVAILFMVTGLLTA